MKENKKEEESELVDTEVHQKKQNLIIPLKNIYFFITSKKKNKRLAMQDRVIAICKIDKVEPLTYKGKY